MAEDSKEVTRTERKGETQPPAPTRALSPFEEMDRLFERFFPPSWPTLFRWAWPDWGQLAMPFEGRMPNVDVIDRDEEGVVRAEAPGVDKENLDVSGTENTITIRGTSRTEEEEGEYYRREMVRGAFSRTIMLPSEVKGEKATATFKEGTLELVFPNSEKIPSP